MSRQKSANQNAKIHTASNLTPATIQATTTNDISWLYQNAESVCLSQLSCPGVAKPGACHQQGSLHDRKGQWRDDTRSTTSPRARFPWFVKLRFGKVMPLACSTDFRLTTIEKEMNIVPKATCCSYWTCSLVMKVMCIFHSPLVYSSLPYSL